MIVFSSISPHPPIIIPGIGKENDLYTVEKTIQAMEKLRIDFEKSRPDTVVIISPHAPIDSSSFGVNQAPMLEGDLSQFGLSQSFLFENNTEIIQSIKQSCSANQISIFQHENFLDHGSLIPLFYLAKNIKPKLVALSFSFLNLQAHYAYGTLLGDIFEKSSKSIAVIASGDLSHRLTLDAPAGFSPRGCQFDEELLRLLKKRDIEGILNLDPEFIEDAGECGLRSFVVLLGILHAKQYRFECISYEGPFGVGYLVGNFQAKSKF